MYAQCNNIAVSQPQDLKLFMIMLFSFQMLTRRDIFQSKYLEIHKGLQDYYLEEESILPIFIQVIIRVK